MLAMIMLSLLNHIIGENIMAILQRRKTGRLWVVLQIMIPHWLNDIMKETLVQVKSQVIK